jgi:hypothetical protein
MASPCPWTRPPQWKSASNMRQYGEVPPWLAAANTPAVSATTGLGTGGGASVQTPDSGGFGEVFLQIGSNPSAGGSVALTFPSTPPTLFVSGSEELGTVTQATVSNVVTVTWAGTPRLKSKQQIDYEWASSF